jgi:hypothetical protein
MFANSMDVHCVHCQSFHQSLCYIIIYLHCDGQKQKHILRYAFAVHCMLDESQLALPQSMTSTLKAATLSATSKSRPFSLTPLSELL